MTEEELHTLHYTSPREMDGANRLRQHDNIHRQMAAFEKLLQHANSRFSKEKLYQMLIVLVRGIPKLRQPHRPKSELTFIAEKITSVGQIRDIISRLQNEKRKGLQREEELHLVKYFETFFRDLEYLRSLKKYFDERIYCCLYEYFYDPESDDTSLDMNPTITNYANESLTSSAILANHESQPQPSMRSDSNNYNHHRNPETSTAIAASKSPIFALTEMNKFNDEDNNYQTPLSVDQMTSKEKLSHAVRELYALNDKWDYLLSDSDLSLVYFDPDSHYELLKFSEQNSFQLVFRLIPDIFVKAYKAIELAKLWWTNANKLYKTMPGKKNSSMQSYSKRMSELQQTIIKMADDLSRDEELLQIHQDDLKTLSARENRFSVLNENCEKVEEMKNSIGTRYNETLKQREALMQKREASSRGYDHHDLETRLRRINYEVLELHDKLRVLTFQFDILEQDLKLELEMRPDIIRFTDHVSEKVTELHHAIKSKRSIKHAREKQLVLLKTNHEKMREIMRKHLRSEDSSRAVLPTMDYKENDNNNIKIASSLSRDRRRSIGQVNPSSSDETGNDIEIESPTSGTHKQNGSLTALGNNRSSSNRDSKQSRFSSINGSDSNLSDVSGKIPTKPARVNGSDSKSRSKIPRHSHFRN